VIAALAIRSLRNRRLTAALTVLSIALSVALLLAVERIREESRQSFASSLSGTDLIVGARASPVQLLLSSVFGIGDATGAMSGSTLRTLAAMPEVDWTIPLALGDSHRGFRVLGTTQSYFDHYRFGRNRGLELAQGGRFADAESAVLGADVAAELGYRLGQRVVIAHGSGEVAFRLHEEHPFRVVGILARTATPVDRTIHVSLEGFEAMHGESGPDGGDPLAAALHNAKERERPGQSVARRDPEPAGTAIDAPVPARTITAVLIGLKSRAGALALQRRINEMRDPTALNPRRAEVHWTRMRSWCGHHDGAPVTSPTPR
jgi:putative ABC transport system permease protein